MKKLIFLFVILCIIFFIWRIRQNESTREISEPILTTENPTSINPSWKTITIDEKTYAYDYFKVSETTDVFLIPNFVMQKLSKSVLTENNCSRGINAGFYDKEYKPLGLFVTDKKTFSSSLSSALLNGFFTIDDSNHAEIQQAYNGATHIALQSGPLLMLNSQKLPLRIKNDEFARRSVASVSRNGDILFFSLFLPDSEISGPLLQNLPNVLMEINKNQKLELTDAINLDGGSASFFKGEETYLEEITTVGGVFCIRE